MKTHIVLNGSYYYATLVGYSHGPWHDTYLQYRTAVGDLFVPEQFVHECPTRLEAYRYMFFNIKDITRWYHSRRICYSYDKLTRIMLKHFTEDFI